MKSIYFLTIILLFSVSITAQDIAPKSGIEDEIAKTESKRFPQNIDGKKVFIGNNYDLKYHRFNWYIDPAVYYIKGSVFSIFQTTASMVQTIEFEMDSALTCDSVVYHHDTISFVHDKQNHVLTISLPGALSVGTLDSVEVFYQGAPNSQTGFGSFEQDYHNNVPVIWTLSQPYGTREWWPCKNNLSDKIDSIDVIVATPNQYRVASNGILVSEKNFGSTKVYTWKHRYPIAAYLIAVAVTNYAHYSHYVPVGNDSIEILNYVFPEDSTSSYNSTFNTVKILNFYNKQFITYPYSDEKYGHAQFGWGGGMEHQTMSFMGGFAYELVSHELAHQWFGDMITCGSWHDIWLNEGFATYLSGLCYEHLDSVHNYWEIWKNAKIEHVTQYPDGSVYVYDTTSVSRVFSGRLSYNKAAMVLHMIRWVIGDSAFYAGIYNYLNDPFLKFGYAYTEDLRNHFENASGTSLTEFFNDWVFGEGHPIYNINIERYADLSVDVTINQSPSHNSVSFFEMPVELKFIGNNVDTSIVFDHTTQGQLFHVNLGFYVKSVEFDPGIWLLAELDTLIVTSVNDRNSRPSIKIFPNPASDKVKIITGEKINSVELITYTGKIVKNTVVFDYNNNFELDLTGVKPGIYLVRIRTEDAVITDKIIKK